MKVRFQTLSTAFFLPLIVLINSNVWASSEQTHCILIGDSQTSSSLGGGFARSTINELEERGVRVTSYSMSSTSARHWHNPRYNPLRDDIITGRMRVYPDNAIIPNLDAHSSRSLFQQIIDHHNSTEHPANCIIFQLGDNAPRTGEIASLTRQWQAYQETPAQCFFVSPTWPEERHPGNEYRFKTRQRTIEMRREIEAELAQDQNLCQHISTTGNHNNEDETLLNEFRDLNTQYTSDGLHLNIRGGNLWSRAVVQQIDQLMNTPIEELTSITPAQVETSPEPPVVQTTIRPPITPSLPIDPPSIGTLGLSEPPSSTQEEVSPTPTGTPGIEEQEIVAAPQAEEQQYQIFELVCRSNLNMRVSPGASSTLIGRIPCTNSNNQRERVAVLEHDEETGWFKIVYNEQVAWVSGDYLRPTEESISIPQVATETTTTGILNCRSNLNMRYGPSSAYLVQGQIPCRTDGSATPIQVIGVDPESGWLYVNYNGTNSFVHPRYVTTHNQISNQITNIISTLQCQHTTLGCPQQAGAPPQREDCEGCDDEIMVTDGWLPGCEILQRRNLSDSDHRQLQVCFSSIQQTIMSGSPGRSTAFRRMYQRLNPAEQRFLAMTLTAMGEIPPNFANEEMQIVMRVIDNRVNYARSRGNRNANALDVALQPSQFSMYNSSIGLWRPNLQSGSNARHRSNAINAYIRYQNASFRPPEQIDRVYHYHANYVSPDWRNNSRIVRPLVNGVGLRQSGTRHIFYRDIPWSFRHNSWSGK